MVPAIQVNTRFLQVPMVRQVQVIYHWSGKKKSDKEKVVINTFSPEGIIVCCGETPGQHYFVYFMSVVL